jgi:tetratricopeptide (TPR) repeat protein
MLEKLHRYREAAEAFEQAAQRAPHSAQAHFNLGWGYEITGSLEKAVSSFERALEIDPSHVHALANLAVLAYGSGKWARAKDMAARALAIDPKMPSALITLIRVALEERDISGAEAMLESMPDATHFPPMDRAILQGVTGDLRHAQKRYAEAFAAYSSANAQKKAIFAPKYDRDGQESTTTHLQWIMDYFRDVPAEMWAAKRSSHTSRPADENGPREHVFLVGFPRSGTTLLENILASHPQIESLEEKELLSDAFTHFMSNARGRDQLAKSDTDDLQKYRDQYWNRVRSFGLNVKGKVFIDKHPLISVRMMMVAKMFPDAKILFAIRDPRDVVLSCFRRSFNMNFSMYPFLSLDTAAAYYAGVMELSRIEHEKFNLDWYDLSHETLVSDFEAEVRKVCDFIGLAWSDEMNDFAARAKTKNIATPSAVQVIRGLNSDGIGAWRNYKDQLAPILPVLAPWVKAYGYEPD